VGRHWQICYQLPEDGCPAFRRIKFLGMDDLEVLVPVFPLLSDRRADRHRGMSDRQHGAMVLALRIAEPDLVGAASLHLCHHLGNGRAAILRQTIDAAAHEEPRPELFGQAVEFVNVAFPIPDMHATLWRPRQFGGQAQIVEPAHAFLLFNRYPGRIDLAFEGGGSLEFAARPEFRRRQSERQTLRRDGHAGMHQEPADRMLLEPTFLQLASGRYLREPHLLWSRPLEGEFRGVLQDQNGAIGCFDAQGRGGEMALKDLVFADIPIGKKAVGGLGVRPVLKCCRQRFPRPFPECLEHCIEPPVQPHISQIASGSFRFHPTLSHVCTSIIRCHMTNHGRFLSGKTNSGG